VDYIWGKTIIYIYTTHNNSDGMIWFLHPFDELVVEDMLTFDVFFDLFQLEYRTLYDVQSEPLSAGPRTRASDEPTSAPIQG
jgi:hypothetical protein